MIDETAFAEKRERWIADCKSRRIAFSQDVIDQIGDEFDFPVAFREVIAENLDCGAQLWAYATKRVALDFEAVRRELATLEKAARSIAEAISSLSADMQAVLLESGEARVLNGLPMPCVKLDGSTLALEYEAAPIPGKRSISLDDIAHVVAAFGQCASDAESISKASRKGRPEQEGLFHLVHAGFQVWESLLGRAFKLDWASDGKPITDAARFSVRIAHVVDPTATLQQIATASRKAREKGMRIRNLEELPQVIDHYRKQFE